MMLQVVLPSQALSHDDRSVERGPVRVGAARLNRFLLLLLCLGLALAGATSANAQESAQDSDFKADVLDLLDQLDAAQLLKRQQAERQLIEMGPDALPLLPTDPGLLSAEARLRLSRVRLALEKERAQREVDAALIEFDDVSTLGEALEAISAATGSEFEVQADPVLPVQIADAGGMPFWQALDTVLDAANLDVNFYGGERGILSLVPRAEGRVSRADSGAYAGVYRLEPTTVVARRVLNKPDLSGLQTAVEIAWEPRLTPIGLTLPLAQLQAKLDDGQTLLPQNAEGELNVSTNADVAFSEIYLPFQLPSGRPRQIESISGVIRALLPGPTAEFAFPLADGEAKQTTGSATVQLDAIRANGPLTEVRVLLTLDDANNALESHRQWVFENPAYVTASDETRQEHLGYEVYRQTANSVGIGYLFDLGEKPEGFTFHYQTPTAVVPNEVAFVMQDILLP